MCRARNCDQSHDKHFCRYCKNPDSDHRAFQCTKAVLNGDSNIRCKAWRQCTERHEKHYCKVCGNSDSDHLASHCVQGCIFYHGTKHQFAVSILQTGWRPSKGGRMGPGVYLTSDLKAASDIARRWKNKDPNCSQFAVLECIIDTKNDNIQEGDHPQWRNQWETVTDGPFKQLVVRQGCIKRIKIVKIHQV